VAIVNSAHPWPGVDASAGGVVPEGHASTPEAAGPVRHHRAGVTGAWGGAPYMGWEQEGEGRGLIQFSPCQMPMLKIRTKFKQAGRLNE